jgi:hypothetical protein
MAPSTPPIGVIGIVVQFSAPARLPQPLEHELQKGQVARFLAHVLEDALVEARLINQPDLPGRLHHGAANFFLVHGAEIDDGVLQTVGQGPIREGVAIEIASQGGHHTEAGAGSRLEQRVDERLRRVFGEGVDLFPLVLFLKVSRE